jgi:hypothetical protein
MQWLSIITLVSTPYPRIFNLAQAIEKKMAAHDVLTFLPLLFITPSRKHLLTDAISKLLGR